MAKIGHIVTEETRQKLRKANLGKKVSDETKKKISDSLKGNSYRKGIKHTDEVKAKISKSHTGVKLSEQHRSTLLGNKRACGMKHSEETKQKMSAKRIGENNGNWKGGITPINRSIRTSLKYKTWRNSVFIRDDYTCVLCNMRGCELNADHIKPFSLYPELRFELSNGRTLCVPCHKKTDTYAGNIKKYGK